MARIVCRQCWRHVGANILANHCTSPGIVMQYSRGKDGDMEKKNNERKSTYDSGDVSQYSGVRKNISD